MGFLAEDAVEPLWWNFRPYVDADGTTDEPSDEQVRQMNLALRDSTKRVTGEDIDPEDRRAVARAYNRLSDDQLRQIEDETVGAIVHVTVLSPTREQIEALPFRLRRKYIRSLLKDINDPESEASDTNGSQPAVTGASSATS